VVGGNFRLDALQAAVLRVKLPYLDGWTERRQLNAATYRRLFTEAELSIDQRPGEIELKLAEISGVVLPFEAPNVRHIYNQFVIRSGQRDQLLAHLKERKIGTEIYYPVPMHVQECFAGLGYENGDFPASERAASETLALPIYPELTESMMSTVVDAVADFYR
jgi:dTDP-4-amino-4,6-dideoxygalactose transaminase